LAGASSGSGENSGSMTQLIEARVEFEGKITTFLLSNAIDEVQSYPARGLFYEIGSLLCHRHLIPAEGMTVLDVGSNIGNHALFYARHSNARKVYCFEPNPGIRELLEKNIEANREKKIDLTYASYGCSDKNGQSGLIINMGNLGATRLEETMPDGVPVVSTVTLDSILPDEVVSLIKIDVEGMELQVLAGAAEIIRRCRPAIAIEVANRHIDGFWRWTHANAYHVLHAFRTYWDDINYVCVPKLGPTDTPRSRAEVGQFWDDEHRRRTASKGAPGPAATG
jgi:FkbM family methyltransferase